MGQAGRCMTGTRRSRWIGSQTCMRCCRWRAGSRPRCSCWCAGIGCRCCIYFIYFNFFKKGIIEKIESVSQKGRQLQHKLYIIYVYTTHTHTHTHTIETTKTIANTHTHTKHTHTQHTHTTHTHNTHTTHFSQTHLSSASQGSPTLRKCTQ